MGVLASMASGRRYSFEVVPPSRGHGMDEILAAVEAVRSAVEPAFVSVTDHPGGRAWADLAGSPSRISLKAKPGTLGTAVALRQRFGIDIVPHLIATNADRIAVEELLVDLHYAGFSDLFAVMGDERRLAGAPAPSPASHGDYPHAADLVEHVMAMNRGIYLPPVLSGEPTGFTVGVAGYPGKHYAAPNLEADIDRLVAKVGAGASYVITQMVFDAASYARFVAALRERGVEVPILAGLKPIFRAAQCAALPANFFIDLPSSLCRALEDARSPAEERAAGLDFTVRLARELLQVGAPGLHFFTMGSGKAVREVLEALR